MKPKIYIETSVISYLSARPSRDLIVAANQQITNDWWQTRRNSFEIYISRLVEQVSVVKMAMNRPLFAHLKN